MSTETLVNRWDQTTWDTSEVYDWMQNDEPDYRAARRCVTVRQLRDTFHGVYRGDYPDIDWDAVDWDLIFDTIQEE